MTKHRIYTMSFASVYPHYIAKAERKGRTKLEVDAIIRWLTGYTQKQFETQLKKQTDVETFIADAPRLNPSRALIKGVVCGVRVRASKNPPCAKFAIWTNSSMNWPKGNLWKRF